MPYSKDKHNIYSFMYNYKVLLQHCCKYVNYLRKRFRKFIWLCCINCLLVSLQFIV